MKKSADTHRTGTDRLNDDARGKGVRSIEDSRDCNGRLTRDLFAFWNDLKKGRIAPLVSDFNYLDCPELLGSLMVLDVLYDPLDFEIRYLGTDIVVMFGADDTRRTMRQLTTEHRDNPDDLRILENTLEMMSRCSLECLPLLSGRRQVGWSTKDFIRSESLTVPFADEHGCVTRLATAMDVKLIMGDS